MNVANYEFRDSRKINGERSRSLEGSSQKTIARISQSKTQSEATVKMIPQNLTSPPLLRNELPDGSDKILGKSKKPEKDYEKADRTTVSLKNLKNEIEESIVQWKQKNIKDGFVIVDEAQLSKLIKREPIEKYYKLEQEPFATGVFASLRRCQSLETGVSYAAKFSSRDRYGEDCSTEIYHEIALLSLCGSAPRVIQIHDVFENEREIIIVMEYAPGGDLQTIIDEDLVPFESDVMSFIKQTVEGLEYLHRRRIAHLDIKPQNIVMMGDYPKCEIKLCDFEISRVILEGTTIRELLGTPDYVAPEILHYDPITLAADMWSLGVTTYVLLTGFSPFGGETDQETFCNISKAEVDFPDDLFKDVSNEAIDFIKSLLVKNPRERLTASGCLKHPWLNSNSTPPKVIEPPPAANNEVVEKEEEIYKTRNGCETCQAQKQQELIESNSPSGKSLRKYLSKSREALFDRVVQKHNNNNNNISRRTTYKNHRFRKTRLCESQISLLSKSRERLLGGETLNTPSRSIEKLYGLRSLSKSQEVLNLYKNGGILASQENLHLVSELIKSRENLFSKQDEETSKEKKLMRATTADLGILHQRHKPYRMHSCSSTISLASLTGNMEEDDKDLDDKEFDEKDQNYNSPFHLNNKAEETTPEPITPEINTKSEKQTREDDKSDLIREIEKLEGRRTFERKEVDEEEPRFTVAQLITAYNRHQELVTKTSLEVTMSAPKKEVKIPPIMPYKSKSLFPTGPTALRLFIPDIDLVEMPKKNLPKYKMRFPDDDKSDSDEKTQNTKEPEQKLPPNSSHHQQYINLNSIIDKQKTTEIPTIQKEPTRSKQEEEKEKPHSLMVGQRRSKSSSPSIDANKMESSRKHGSLDQKLDEAMKKKSPTPTRKLSFGKSVNRSPSATRKPLTVERSPAPQRRHTSRNSRTDEGAGKKSETSQYKIVKIGEKNPNPSRKCSGVSYKIEFDSPVVTRKFPIRNTPTKGTISSNLKVKENPNRTKK